MGNPENEQSDSVSDSVLARLAVHEWNTEDEAIAEIADAEGDIRENRWLQWDRCLAFKLQFGYGATKRLAATLGVNERTIHRYSKCAELIPPELRARDINNTVYYRAIRDEAALDELRVVIESGGNEADYWQRVGKEFPTAPETFRDLLMLAKGTMPKAKALAMLPWTASQQPPGSKVAELFSKSPDELTSFEFTNTLAIQRLDAMRLVGGYLKAFDRWEKQGLPQWRDWTANVTLADLDALIDFEGSIKKDGQNLADYVALAEVPEDALREWYDGLTVGQLHNIDSLVWPFAREYVAA